MLPGRIYKPEDILKILRKRFWVIVLPALIVAAGTAGVARKLPDRYKSTAWIQVTPPQVPGSIVQPSTTATLQNRLQATQQTILSRTRLERLIQEFNLYEEERRTDTMQDVVERMRNVDIQIASVKGDTFTVSYQGRARTTVMKVAERLADYFKQENAREGERRAEGTSSFVESQVEEAHRKLLDIEDKLKAYRIAHSGELPDQLQANMQAVQTINQQAASLAQQVNTDTNVKIQLERQIAALEGMDTSALPAAPGAEPAGTAAQRLAAARAELANMIDVRRLKPDHMDVRMMQAAIKRLEAEAEAEALRAPVGMGAAVSPVEQQRLARLAAWKDDLERLKKQIDLGQAEQARLKTAAAVVQARIDRMPIRQAEMVELDREHETLSRLYTDLIAAREKANMSINLESRQLGEQFVLLEAARVPERPFSPNRLAINLFGIAGGLALGLALVALLEYRDNSFKTDSELATVVGLPVLAVVPVMQSEPERRAAFRRSLLMQVGFASVAMVCLAVLTYSFVTLR